MPYTPETTWNLRINHLIRKHLFQTFIFGFHVKFCGVYILLLWDPEFENGIDGNEKFGTFPQIDSVCFLFLFCFCWKKVTS